MTAKYVSLLYATAAPALGDHLWQSTLFAVIAGLLTLTLRKNSARARYELWLAASLKFLIPFSLLIDAGEHLAWLRGSVATNVRLYGAAGQLGEPFTQNSAQAISRAASSAASPSFAHFLTAIFAALWLAGFAAVIAFWFLRWRRISVSAYAAAPGGRGREIEVLRRVERRMGVRNPIELRLSTSSMEPGVFGIAHPILVWPERISARLDEAQLESILTHEVCHVCRRDNLTAALHMAVEALFWFHPLVWWLGTRLQRERESACDEQVLRLGNLPQIYAEGILKTSEFCVESSLACVPGVTGSDLKNRIIRIMTRGIVVKVGFGKRLLLSLAGVAAVAGPVVFGLVSAPRVRAQSATAPDWQAVAGGKQAFDVASVKQNKSGLPPSGDRMYANMPLGNGAAYSPNGGLFTATNLPVSAYIAFAYKMTPNQLQIMQTQLPKWANTDRFDIQARRSGDPTKDQMRMMMEALLVDRFKLTIHNETRQLPVLALAMVKPGKFGPQIQSHPDDAPCTTLRPSVPASVPGPSTIAGGFPIICDGFSQMDPSTPGRLRIGARRVNMAFIASTLPYWADFDRPVMDGTGLGGTFDFVLEWTPQINGPLPPGSTFQPDPNGPTLLQALRDQLGLKLDSQTGPVDVFVIDHVEAPSEN